MFLPHARHPGFVAHLPPAVLLLQGRTKKQCVLRVKELVATAKKAAPAAAPTPTPKAAKPAKAAEPVRQKPASKVAAPGPSTTAPRAYSPISASPHVTLSLLRACLVLLGAAKGANQAARRSLAS